MNKLKENYFKISSIIFLVTLIILFISQGKGIYSSDLNAHIRFVVVDGNSTYSLFHLVVSFANKTSIIISNLIAVKKETFMVTIVAIFLSGVCTLTAFIVRVYFTKKYLNKTSQFKIDLIVTSLFILAPIWIPVRIQNLTSGNSYLGQGTPNIWHNPTAIVCRLFAFPTFYFLLKSFNNYKENKAYGKELIFIMIFSSVCMYSKPSFLVALIPAYGLFLLYVLIKSKMESFKFSIKTAIAFIPSVMICLYQYIYLFDDTNRTVFKLGGEWSVFSPNIIVSILLGLAFPIYVIIIYNKRIINNSKLLIILITQIISGIQFFIFMEVGIRANNGNFSWGYCLSMSVLFCVTAEVFFLQNNFKGYKKNIGVMLFALHVLFGVLYFIKVANGGSYI